MTNLAHAKKMLDILPPIVLVASTGVTIESEMSQNKVKVE